MLETIYSVCKSVFYFLPDFANFLLIVAGVVELFFSHKVREMEGRPKLRKILAVTVITIAALGIVSNRMQESESDAEIIGEMTGGDTFCYFTIAPNLGSGDPPTFPVTVWVRGTYPMRNVVAELQTVSDDPDEQFRSFRTIPLGDGTLLPGAHPIPNFRLGIGRHIIMIWSRAGLSNQELNIIKASTQFGITQFGDVYRDGTKIHNIPSD